VDRVGEVDGRRPLRQHLDLASRGERVDLFGVEIDFEVLQELLRVAHFLLPFQQLSQPLEILLVSTGANPAFLVLPVRRDPFFGAPVHLLGANLHFEGETVIADHGRVQ
jgi:hypothetical protein